MKLLPSVRNLLLFSMILSGAACGIGAAPEKKPVTEPVVTPEEDEEDVVEEPEDPDRDDGDSIDESRRQRELARTAVKRKEILASMDRYPTWREKFATGSNWAVALDYQVWKPRKRYRDEVADREALFDLALREFFVNWENQSRDIADSDRNRIDVFDHDTEIQNMVALSLAMDQRNATQDKYAKRYGFELFSVFGLIRDTLVQKKHLNALKPYQATIGTNLTMAVEALEWRANANYAWTWEILFQETLDPGPFENRTLKIEALTAAQLTQALDRFGRANVGAVQVADIRGAMPGGVRNVNLNPTVRSAIGGMRLERAERALAREPNAQKRNLGLKLLAEIRKTQIWMK